MKKPISPLVHSLLDYVLAGSLLVLPTAFNLSKDVIKIYIIEACILLPYVAVTKQPIALKPLIPFQVHKHVDPLNVAAFALQTCTKPFKKDQKAKLFNIAFTIAAGITVLLTDWKGSTKRL